MYEIYSESHCTTKPHPPNPLKRINEKMAADKIIAELGLEITDSVSAIYWSHMKCQICSVKVRQTIIIENCYDKYVTINMLYLGCLFWFTLLLCNQSALV